jgi:tetratricopeptide (TPR) repeat protein
MIGKKFKTHLFTISILIFSIYTNAQTADDLEKNALEAFRLKDYQGAIEYFQHLVNVNPKHKYAYFNIGLSLDILHKKEEAIHFYKEALAIDTSYLKAILAVAENSKAVGKYKQAILYYTKALPFDIDKTPIRIDIAECFLALKAYKEANEIIERSTPSKSHLLSQN